MGRRVTAVMAVPGTAPPVPVTAAPEVTAATRPASVTVGTVVMVETPAEPATVNMAVTVVAEVVRVASATVELGEMGAMAGCSLPGRSIQ